MTEPSFADGVEQASDLLLMAVTVAGTTDRPGALSDAMGGVYAQRFREAGRAAGAAMPDASAAMGRLFEDLSQVVMEQAWLSVGLLGRLVDATGRDPGELLREIVQDARDDETGSS